MLRLMRFAILLIPPGSDMKAIKKSYRKLSLEYHPDKNKGDAVAEAMFMKIAKAYEALTDETAKKNYEKFGNPDGRQSMEVSIGLPTFLLEAENANTILIVYLLVLVVLIPSVVCCWYTKSKQYGDNMVMYDSFGFYHHMLTEHSHAKMMPEVLAGSAEFLTKMPMRKDDQHTVSKLWKELKNEGTMAKQRYDKHPVMVKCNLLIHAYLFNMKVEDGLQADLQFMLKYSMPLIDAMIEYSSSRRWLQTTINVIEFAQMMTQGLWAKESSLYQLPHFDAETVKHASQGKKAMKTIMQFIHAGAESQRGTAKFTAEQLEDVAKVCQTIPDIEMEIDCGVADEDEIAENDLITLTVTIDRKNVKAGEHQGPVHAPKFPFRKDESWWLMLGDIKSNRLFNIQKVSSLGKVVEEKIPFMSPPNAGQYSFDVFLKSDSYMDIDLHQTIKITIIPAKELPQFEAHEEDMELDNEPTLFEQVMSGNVEEDSDDEGDGSSSDDSSDDDDLQLTDAEIAKRRKNKQRKEAKKDK